MKRVFLESIEEAPEISRGCALTMGVFDGMHQGHLSILDLTSRTAARVDAEKVVITFSIHPERIVNGGSPAMIITLEHRLRLMERAGMDKAVIIPFGRELRETTAESFLIEFLVHRLNMMAIILGHDSAFGKDRKGDLQFLEARKDGLGFEVLQAPEVKVREATISSTRVREAIRSGDLPLVEEMLGRELSLFGKVVPGDARGRQIGFPTANLDCQGAILPSNGVYAVKVLHKGIKRRAVMNVGTRPTFYEGKEVMTAVVEVHIPNFQEDLYGADLEVFITRKIRDEMKFSSVDELIEAIHRDIASLGQ